MAPARHRPVGRRPRLRRHRRRAGGSKTAEAELGLRSAGSRSAAPWHGGEHRQTICLVRCRALAPICDDRSGLHQVVGLAPCPGAVGVGASDDLGKVCAHAFGREAAGLEVADEQGQKPADGLAIHGDRSFRRKMIPHEKKPPLPSRVGAARSCVLGLLLFVRVGRHTIGVGVFCVILVHPAQIGLFSSASVLRLFHDHAGWTP